MIGAAITVTSMLFLIAGIAWPQAADMLVRAMLATLAVGYVAARAYEALLPVGPAQRTYSPFDGDVATRTPPAAPYALRELTVILRAADDTHRSRSTAIPWTVRQTVTDDIARRLKEHHGLNIGDADHHARIRSLVSAPTWRLLGRGEAEAVPLSELDTILNDLETL